MGNEDNEHRPFLLGEEGISEADKLLAQNNELHARIKRKIAAVDEHTARIRRTGIVRHPDLPHDNAGSTAEPKEIIRVDQAA